MLNLWCLLFRSPADVEKTKENCDENGGADAEGGSFVWLAWWRS